MEQLIPLIIMLLIGSLMSTKKKKANQQKKDKPFTAQDPESGPLGKLKEMYQELQQEMQPETREREIQQTQQHSIPRPSNRLPVEITTPKVDVPKEKPKRRASAQRIKVQNQQIQQTTNSRDIMPKSKDDLIKGIIFSEIFGPPISKR